MGTAAQANLLQLLTYAALSTSALVVPLYAQQLGASFEFIGLIGTVHGLAGVASAFIFGRLGDRTDRRTLLAFGFAAAALAYTLQFYATTPGLFLLARTLVGFAAAIVPATLVAYVYDIKRPLGNFTSYNAIGWLLGSGLLVAAGALVDARTTAPFLRSVQERVLAAGVFELLFLASGALCLVGWLLARRLPSMRVHLDVPHFPARLIAANAHVYLSLFLRHLGATAIWTIFPLYVISIGGDLALVGWLHILNMIAQIALFRSVDRFPRLSHPRLLIGVGLALSAAVFAGFALARDAVHLLPLQLVVGLSFAALWLGCLKEILDHNVERATASGLLNASMSLSNVVGPLVGGVVAAHYGFRAVLYVGALITVGALAFFWTLQPGAARPHAATPATAPRPVGEVGP